MNKNEKRFTLILVVVAFLAIVAVIMFNIPWGGDKAAINKEYDSIESNDHVFETITFENLIKKIQNNETFQVYVGSGELPQAETFVYVTNKLAKERGIDTIYYLRYLDLSTSEWLEIQTLSSTEMSVPTLIYWVEDETESVPPFISGLKNFEDYNHNWSILLTEYFDECYQ
jgi:hypothetical protein